MSLAGIQVLDMSETQLKEEAAAILKGKDTRYFIQSLGRRSKTGGFCKQTAD